MKKIILPVLTLIFMTSCAELQQASKQLSEMQNQGVLGQNQIASALKEALELGVSKQVINLTKNNGFYNNSLVRIPVPSELQKVEKALRAAGLGNLADEGVKAMNKAAEVAVKEITMEGLSKIVGTPMTLALILRYQLNSIDDYREVYYYLLANYIINNTKEELANTHLQEVLSIIFWKQLCVEAGINFYTPPS